MNKIRDEIQQIYKKNKLIGFAFISEIEDIFVPDEGITTFQKQAYTFNIESDYSNLRQTETDLVIDKTKKETHSKVFYCIASQVNTAALLMEKIRYFLTNELSEVSTQTEEKTELSGEG